MEFGVELRVKLVLDFVQHKLVYIQTSLKAIDLWIVLSNSFLHTTKVKALVQIQLKLSGLKLSHQSHVAQRFLAICDTRVVLGHFVVVISLEKHCLVVDWKSGAIISSYFVKKYLTLVITDALPYLFLQFNRFRIQSNQDVFNFSEHGFLVVNEAFLEVFLFE